ncbi:MAG: transcriptional regulator [Mycobacterium sp.]|nr:transcriptional regulator [Mycobacterium sp.]
MAELEHPAADTLQLTAVLFALSDPARLAIVRQLAAPEQALTCQSVAPEMPKSTRSHHLKVLREAGVTRAVQAGRERLLTLRSGDLDARWPGLLAAVLTDAPDARPDMAIAR